MAYKNLFYRLFFSLLIFVLYFISINNKNLLLLFGTLIYIFIYYEIYKYFKIFFKLILFYLFFSYFCFILYFSIFFDYFIFNFFVFTIILFDSFSYINGKFFGKHFIFKSISPKKTLEGYLGGILFTNLILILYFFFIKVGVKITEFIIILNLSIIFSIIGDLVESYFKRKNNIKDSSKYLPGHGGFFDRFDSFIASIIFLTIFSALYNI
tara:strand:- start:1256 stop:1885 length:630 start_codon:yes stop_codon:yes gene_type:complete